MILSKALRAAAGNIAPAPPSTDPQFNYVSMLLHGDGTNGAQNNTFLDSSSNNFTITRNGNTTQGSLSPYGNLWSNFFDGTGDWLTVPSNSAFDQTGDFTFETWVRVDATVTGTYSNFGNVFSQETPNIFKFGFNKSRQFVVLEAGAGSPALTSTTTFAIGVWYHVAVVRSGMSTNNLKLYVNGVQEAQTTKTNSVASANTTFIGREAWSGDPGTLTGAISNLRYVNGTAVYTSAFTPPTAPLTAISGTSLLTCQSNRFIDNSANNFTITRNGDVRVTKEAPFLPTAAYSTSVIGGSGYFDGAGDGLTTSNATAFALSGTDFTIEAWINLTGYSSNYSGGNYGAAICASKSSGSISNGFEFDFQGTASSYTSLAFVARNGTSNAVFLNPSFTFLLNTWYHIALVKSGSTFTFYVNGVSISSTTNANTWTNLSDLQVGWSGMTGYEYYFPGYISNFRIVKGTAVYTSNFTPPTAPLTAITNTSLLLNFTNAGIFDNAAENDLETVGNAQISTSVKKYGTGSLAFDGTGDWLLVPNNTNLQLGSGSFTVEGWVNLALLGSARGLVSKGTSTTGWSLSVNSLNQVVFTDATTAITTTTALMANTWYHVAVVRSGTGTNQTVIYIDGVSSATGTSASNFNQTSVMYVGADRTGGSALNGYLDDLRITKGYARYTSTFTPPTAAFPDQ